VTQYQISDVAQRVYARAAYPEKGQSIVVSNNDNSFTLYASDNQSVTPQSDQIEPQSSLSFDGSRDIWLSSLDPAVTISAQVVRGGTQLTLPPGAIAEAFVASGVPIIGAPVQLYNVASALALPTGIEGVFITPVNPSPVAGLASADYLSYEIVMGLEAGSGSAKPFADVNIYWYDYDQIPQAPVDTVRIVVPMGANGDPDGPAVITGRGPMRGGYMRIEINNLDTVSASLAFLQGAGTSRTVQKDNWSWDIDQSPAIPGYTVGNGGGYSLFIGQIISQVIAAGKSFSAMYGLAAGEVYLREHVSGLTTNQCEFNIQALPPASQGAQYIHRVFLGSTSENEEIIAFPRAPVLMTITNNSTDQATVDMSMIAIQ
jgi:hypothetical protein